MANYATSSLKLSDTYVNTLPYNTCSTAAGTAAKTVSAGDFSLETGAMVVVKFTVTNTAANPTLNVSSTGAKAIYYNGAAITAGYLKANKVYQFIYNGTQWDLVGDVDTDTNTNTNYYHTPSYTSTAPSSPTGGSSSNIKIGTGTGVNDLYIPVANGSTPGVTIVYPSASCTTFTSDTGSCTPAAVRKAVSMFDPKTHTHDYIPTSQKGTASGVAELDANGKVPTAQLPSFVDDVLEYSAKSSFPATGETGKIYVDTTTNLTYRWSGTAYVEISPSLAVGTTSSTAYRGDRGNTAYTHSQSTHARTDATATAGSTTNGNIKINGTETTVYTHPVHSAKSSGLYKVTVDSSGHVSAATAVTKSDITALGIPGSDTNTNYYHTPSHTSGIKIGTGSGVSDMYVPTGTTRSTVAVGNHTHSNYITTDKYHTTGSWSGLTYTATAQGNAGALAFTIPTGTTSTTVAVGNHTHSYVPTSRTVNGKALSSDISLTASDVGAAASSHGTHVTAATVKSALGTGSGTTKYLREDGSWATPSVTVTAVWG